MLILSLDSAGSSCSACVWRDGQILAIGQETMERGQDQRLMPLILDVMKQANVTFNALDRIAVTRGPGSFTGLRIGLAAARGMGLASGKPVVGIDRFSIFHAQHQKPDRPMLVVINSKRKELFCRFYDAKGIAHHPIMMTPEEIAVFLADKNDILIAGDAVLTGVQIFSANEPETITCALLASQADITKATYAPIPLYLRAPDVTMKKPTSPDAASDA